MEVDSHLKALVLIEEPEEDGSISKEYSQWVAVVVVAAADGTAAHKKPTATGQMRKVNIGWFLVRFEDDVSHDGVEEWQRLPGNAFNNNARGSGSRTTCDTTAWRNGRGSRATPSTTTPTVPGASTWTSRLVAVSRAAGAAAVTSADAATAAAAVAVTAMNPRTRERQGGERRR